MFKYLSALCLLYGSVCYDISSPILPVRKNSILFFPFQVSCNEQLPVDIYGQFKKSLENNGFNVFQSSGNINEDCNLINDIKIAGELDIVTVVSHSSGINNLLKVCEKTHMVNNVVLIDPILLKETGEKFTFLNDNNNLEDAINDFLESDKVSLIKGAIFKKSSKPYITLENVDKLLYISSKKSSRWKIIPPVPPIKRLFLEYDIIKTSNKTLVTIPDYGHFDILDSQWSDMIHNSVCIGSNSRESLTKYHDEIASYIKHM